MADNQGERPPTSRLSRLGALDKYLRGFSAKGNQKGDWMKDNANAYEKGHGLHNEGGRTLALGVGKVLCRLGKVNFAYNHKGRTSRNQHEHDGEKKWIKERRRETRFEKG